jgi:DHA1 family tetracycline resistance protein-like MFS transporter
LIRPALRYLGERGCVFYGHIGDIAIFLMIAFVWSGKWLLILTPLAALPGVITPALQGMMSKAVGDDQQGELQGALTSIAAIAMIPAPLIMTAVFAMFSRPDAPVYVPGAPFILGSALMCLSLVVFLRASPPGEKQT